MSNTIMEKMHFLKSELRSAKWIKEMILAV